MQTEMPAKMIRAVTDRHRGKLRVNFDMTDHPSFLSPSFLQISYFINCTFQERKNFKVTEEEKLGTVLGSDINTLVALSFKTLQINLLDEKCTKNTQENAQIHANSS